MNIPADRPVLVIVSDAPELSGGVSAGGRDVRRWSQEGGAAIDGQRGGQFSGDPAAPETYRWTAAASDVSVVIALRNDRIAAAAARAVRSVRHDAAVLILCEGCDDAPGDGTLARSGRLRDVLRLDLEDELQRLEAQRRAYCLRRFAQDAAVVPILLHPDPDPDALSSALAVRALLRRQADTTPILTFGAMTRPENRRMASLLDIEVTEVGRAALKDFDKVVVVDAQPSRIGREQRPRFAVIDHHPREAGYEADYCDIRPSVGATATMLTQYLRVAEPARIERTLAAALLNGIRSDTRSLTRGVTAADVEAYAFLQPLADPVLLRQMERPILTHGAARSLGRALARSRTHGDVVVASMGEISPGDRHELSVLADFCLGIEHVTWVAVFAFAGDDFVLSLRYQGKGPGAGELARRIAQDGSGGGHATMARVVWSAADAKLRLGASDEEGLIEAVLRLVRENAD